MQQSAVSPPSMYNCCCCVLCCSRSSSNWVSSIHQCCCCCLLAVHLSVDSGGQISPINMKMPVTTVVCSGTYWYVLCSRCSLRRQPWICVLFYEDEYFLTWNPKSSGKQPFSAFPINFPYFLSFQAKKASFFGGDKNYHPRVVHALL